MYSETPWSNKCTIVTNGDSFIKYPELLEFLSWIEQQLILLVYCLTLWLITFSIDKHRRGNLFTMFLHDPLMAFCYVCNIYEVPVDLWDKCSGVIDKFMAEASKLFSRSKKLGMHCLKLWSLFPCLAQSPKTLKTSLLIITKSYWYSFY